MVRTPRLFGVVVALVGIMAFIGTTFAKHQQHAGHQLLGNKINTDGKHELHKRGDHTVHVHVANKKVSRVTVTHRTKGDVAVKKYKTSKKMVQASDLNFASAEVGKLVQPASYQVVQAAIVYIGYAYTDGIDEYIYWFPAEMVVDPYTGAVEYVPVA
jgi:hypothetical protein